MFSDGSTALSWRTEDASYLAQNWDWMEAQKKNPIVLTITQAEKPTIKMVTEAGLIGKIGLNSAGVGGKEIGEVWYCVFVSYVDCGRNGWYWA